MSKTTVLCASPHTHPDPPFSSTCLAKAGRGPGAGDVVGIPPLPLLPRFILYFAAKQSIDTVST